MRAAKITLAGRERYLMLTVDAMVRLEEEFGGVNQLIDALGDQGRQGAAAAGVAVHLRHYHAVELHALAEGLHHVHGILAGHGIHHHEHLVGLHSGLYALGLLHHVLIHMQAACRIQNHYIISVLRRMLYGSFGNIYRILMLSHGKNRNSLSFSVDLQLLDRCRTIYIASCQKRFAPFGLQLSGNLRRGGSLTGALKSCHHDHRDLIGRL